jgi:Asp-tRNA(Asn)/Glu-tRNA(Gln) amidotransferase A subunit family amidase
VREFDLPPGSETLLDRHYVIMGYETARALAWEYEDIAKWIRATLKPCLDEGWRVTRAEYDAVREVDLLFTPSAPGEAWRSLASTGDPVFNRAWTLLGVPCVIVRYGMGEHGLPLGVQLVGAFDGDSALLGWAPWVAEMLGS